MPTNEFVLDERIEKSLRAAHEKLAGRGGLLPEDQLKACYDLFRSRFGPERLRGLDGEPLLELMHTHGNQESLVYWLEFKNDAEFPGLNFGSIAGGSAHKFELFRRKETGQWVSGSVQNEVAVTVQEAVAIARKHRDQLLAGVEALQRFPSSTSDEDYLKLQEELDSVAPDVSRLGWGHKYFSLLFPEKLDDYQSNFWQRFQLIKLLQLPPVDEKLYVCAGRFVKLAQHFGWPMNHLTNTLNERNGDPIYYWRIGTRLGGAESIWPAMRNGGFVAIGWASLGDLSLIPADPNLKEALRLKLAPQYPNDAKTATRKAGEIRDFFAKIEKGEIVMAAEGQRILGVGRVTGDYRFEETEPKAAPHRRPVEWVSLEEWSLPEDEGKLTTVFRVQKHEENLVEVERHMLGQVSAHKPPVSVSPSAAPKLIQLDGILGRIQAILERKNQVIVYGPPGTGKTYWARRAARDLASIAMYGRLFQDLSVPEQAEIEGDARKPGLVRTCTFHPAYGYEDFIEGYRPHQSQVGQLVFVHREGIFRTICRDAQGAKERKFFLLIDEINRGDIPRIFGELLTLLEKDKRGMEVSLPVSGQTFSVPPNVFILGTMNTADRSIALLDTALRRRFGFVELMPDASVLAGSSVGGHIPLELWLRALNDRIRTYCGRDARNLQVGHAYFMEEGRPVASFSKFARIVAEDIIPLLEEYCYEDYGALKNILGEGLVDEHHQRIRDELFAPAQQEKLVQALSAISPEMSTSLQAAKVTGAPRDSDEATEPEDSEP